MEYFATCGLNDSSQGVLSDYVRYLKSDAKGFDFMYDDLDKQIKEIVEKKTTADHLAIIMKKLRLSFHEALETLNIPEKDYDDYTALLNYFYPEVMKA